MLFRILCFALALLASSAAAAPLSPAQRAEDFDAAWRAIHERYAYFDGKRDSWRKARNTWRPRAVRARDEQGFAAALQGALDELRDDHVTLSPGAARHFPRDSDIHARRIAREARVDAVRASTEADIAGVRPGDRIRSVNGVPVDRAIAGMLKGTHGPQADAWALERLLAGPERGVLALGISSPQGDRAVQVERKAGTPGNGSPILARRMGERRDLGYIRLSDGLDGRKPIEQFVAAFEYLRDTRALMVDLRSAPEGISREATLTVLGSFVDRPTPWQLREAPGKPRTADRVAPRGPSPYRQPVLVLVDAWTAGEAEALAAGLVAVANARLVGTRMAGLRGELAHVRLPHSEITVSFPGERSFAVDGTPREKLEPHVEVDLAAPSGGPGDPILYQALKLLESR